MNKRALKIRKRVSTVFIQYGGVSKMQKSVLAIAIVLMGFCSCSKIQSNSNLEQLSGLADTISMGLRFIESNDLSGQAQTKAVVTLDESLVQDLNLYIINQRGGLMHHRYLTSSQLTDAGYGSSEIGSGELINAALEDIVLYTNNKYMVYVVLNWGKALVVNSQEQLLDLKYTLTNIEDIECGSGGVIITGKSDYIELYDGITLEIPVKRIVSKVSLVCDFSGLDSDVELKVKSVCLKNAPKEVVLFGDNVAGSVINGEMRNSEQLLNGLSTTGISFYTLENIQGNVAGATSNKEKANLLGSRRSTATYIEVVCSIVTNEKKGDITYRFYLGTAHNNANIYRNTTQVIKVAFKGEASVDENSVSVDNTSLVDRVTDMYLNPMFISFIGRYGDQESCEAVIIPSTAIDKSVVWSSSYESVATVDQDGVITAWHDGIAYITATSVENPSISASCKVSVAFQ